MSMALMNSVFVNMRFVRIFKVVDIGASATSEMVV
jgi:hypothetical protein